MGKSDPLVFKYYLDVLGKDYGSDTIAFVGQPGENSLSIQILGKNRLFYDLSLGNWNINKFPYEIDKNLDAIFCTRCAYFSNQPLEMLRFFYKALKPGGKVLIDWGMGDHWRFKDFKIGWLKNGEHEWAYESENYLWSGYISDKMVASEAFINFEKSCQKFGYISTKDAIFKEINFVITPEDITGIGFRILQDKSLFLWPESPQLYTCLLLEKR